MNPFFDLIQGLPFLLPILNLGLVFVQQCTSGYACAIISVMHALSNPIDALWSILCRQEVIRRCNVFAGRKVPDAVREFTAVLATYDQWFEDSRPDVSRSLRARQTSLYDTNINSQALVSDKEKALIRDAALRLRSCRSNSLLDARLSVISHIISLAIVGYKMSHLSTSVREREAEHLLALNSIFAYLIFAVYANSSVGSFAYPEEAIRIIFKLHTALREVTPYEWRALPLLPKPSSLLGSDGTLMTDETAASFARCYNQLGSVSGSLNCIRPHKLAHDVDGANHQYRVSLVVSISAVVCSSIGAISIFACTTYTNKWRDVAPVLMVSTLWTLNWVLCLLITHLLTKESIGIATYSRICTASDLAVAGLVLICFGWMFMRLESVSHIDAPFTPTAEHFFLLFGIMVFELAVILSLLCVAQFGNENARLIYLRSIEEALADSEAIPGHP